MYYNLILASPFSHDFNYLWSGPLFTTVIAIMVMYAVFRLHLFNARVVATEFLIALMSIFTFLRTLLAVEPRDQFFNAILFVLTVVLGTLLIRSVNKEIRSRELIQSQEKELEKINKNLELANRNQENLIHFITHEVKGYFTKSQMGFAAVANGDYGHVPDALKEMAAQERDDIHQGVEMVSDILGAANFKKGVVNYVMVPFDVVEAARAVFNEFVDDAKERGLVYTFIPPKEGVCKVQGDKTQLTKHVFHNLIDNAIKYTHEGSVEVSVLAQGDRVRFMVVDTGVGVTPEDRALLFTEGGRGKDSLKVNVHSTGYGLFIAKSIVVAHHGCIRVDSAGAGRGATFSVELPRVSDGVAIAGVETGS